MFIGKYNKSVIVTYLGVLSTMIGIFLALGTFGTPHITGAVICLMISGICDMFDGKIARMCKGRTEEDVEYGIQIDSLTDMISFIAFPIAIMLGISKYMAIELCGVIAVPLFAIFTICGISRLAYFNLSAHSEDGPVKYYSGLPVTTTSMIFPAAYLLKYVVSNQVFISIYLALFAVVAFLFVFNFKIKKPKKNWWYSTCTGLAVLLTLVLLFLKYIK